MPSVDSSAIRRIEYRPSGRTLEVTFVTGRRYVYFDVWPQVYRQFAMAPSKGEFFNFYIRDRYEFEELPRSQSPDDAEG
ncbi:KTSC domain-containing protein [Bradyrhizobium sp. LHD-71]|uniref:KTSC domain-containing protein n=1 Tax=Bradyrhizobium sp. LHD-71 TaxID=3072141 RepID=UPI00280D2FE3|nr:KTSC domain-containing protein [Bradyrhizobium sp. LHD-71]MDQ8729927.1 KTSC domain-containing protein [Bradyrhizobium sp. LHD-71]